MRSLRFLILFIVLVVAFAACARQENPTPTPAQVEEPPASDSAPAEPAATTAAGTPLDSMDFVIDPQLVGITWLWERRTGAEDGEVILSIPDPENYTIIFNDDATFNAKLDCNDADGRYATGGEGNIILELNIMVLTGCPGDSFAGEMADMFDQARNYLYEEDGNVVIFEWAEDGLVDQFRKAGTTAPPPSTGESPAGTIWTLTELNGQPPLPDTPITLEITEEGQVSGSAGCNNYNASYEIDGNSISIGLAATTLKACPEPIMAQESAYLGALEAAATFDISEDGLILFDVDGEPISTFSVVSQELAGSSWEVIAYNNGREAVVSVIIGTKITANFDQDGQLTGNASCNDYFGPYEADGENISMGPFGATSRACSEPEGVMDQETGYLAALETAATYKIDGQTMNMRTAEGATVANFVRAEPGVETPDDGQEALALSPDQISLDTQGLPYAWQAVVVPETPYDQSQPPGPMGLPTHIEILFGASDPADRQPNDPIMYIIPANNYRQLWDDAGNDSVTRTMQEIQQLNFVLPSPAPTSGYPALPYEEVRGANDLAVQVGQTVSQADLNTTSATQDGYRLVGRWAQDANPVTNQGLRYVYQGFTNDGVYLVSFWYPVTNPFLYDTAGDVPAEEMDDFNGDPSGSINAAAEALNGLSTAQWTPDLATLDALVASLEIEDMVAAGLVDKTWQWTQGPAQPGSSEKVTIQDPSLYQVTYGSDGTMTYVADCNSGSMSYTLNNAGMTGGMLAQPGPMTLAACGPESLSDAFIASLQASQDYRVWAGGNELELVLPAGGGTLLLRSAGAPVPESAESATVSGMVTNQDGVPIPEGATLSVKVEDTSLADVPAVVIREQIITDPGQFPIAYQVSYDPGQIQENLSYSMRARITGSDGTLLFINDTNIPVITGGNPTENVEIPVIVVAEPSDQTCVTGSITYPQRIALPEEAVVQVQIQDVSLADVSASVIGEQIITGPGQVPIPFEVCYDPSQIQENHTYAMSVRITGGDGSLLWINDTFTPVITNRNPTENVEIVIVPVG